MFVFDLVFFWQIQENIQEVDSFSRIPRFSVQFRFFFLGGGQEN